MLMHERDDGRIYKATYVGKRFIKSLAEPGVGGGSFEAKDFICPPSHSDSLSGDPLEKLTVSRIPFSIVLVS
ncbi:hypothetical protein EYF80_025122 [Liparis tanakae]|uniref:Uncharacterized protein n=1 Tax=Liparis tanakae TaxID=230148 RepID=A0A4Z2HI40_9TELE|nr:hypothetical protein EYF80_025122 [Liparis tanakae]